MKKYSFFILFLAITLAAESQNLNISGAVTPPCDATVTLKDGDGNTLSTISTADSGTYIFSNLERGENYEITVSREDDVLDGVSTFDLVQISKHIMGVEEFTDPLVLFSADVDGSESVSIMDMVILRRVIIGIDDNFPVDSWQFFSTDAQVENPLNPWLTTTLKTRVYPNLSESINDADFIGYKTADVNNSNSTDCN